MARRRTDVRRRVLVLSGSLAGHFLVFLIALKQFQFFPPPPEQPAPMQVEIVPETIPPIVRPPPPPPLPPIVKQETPKPTPQPKPQVQPPQPPKPQQVAAKPQVAPKPTITMTAPVKIAINPTLSPAPRPAPKASDLAPPIPSQIEGPPKPVPASSLVKAAPQQSAPAHTLILHKSENGSPLAPSVSFPGAVFAQPAPAGGTPPAGGQPGGAGQTVAGAGGGNLPGGALPGFGRGLRGGALGCMNAEALHLSPAEIQRCQEVYGANTLAAPHMDRIDASKRTVLDQEAAGEQAAQKYRDSMPTGPVTSPIPGQPHNGQTPSQ